VHERLDDVDSLPQVSAADVVGADAIEDRHQASVAQRIG
jgi:hypothetical protein